MSQLDVLRFAEQALSNGVDVYVATVVETWGSSPRPVGSLMVYAPEQGIAGSVSGGCLEQQLLESVVHAPEASFPQWLEYGISESDRERFRLPCGGRMTLLVERWQSEDDTLTKLAFLLETLEAHRSITRKIERSTGGWQPLTCGRAVGVEIEGDTVYQTLGAGFRLLIVGAGETSRFLARFAQTADFSVTVCDPRAAYLEGWQESGVSILHALPDELIEQSFMDQYCAIIALAHDPRVDDMGLMAALRGKSFFVGAMGSQRTSAQRRERLYALGLSRSQIGRLHAPVGFDIGSKTPAEIAIATMAQLLAERSRLTKTARNIFIR